MNEAQKHLSEAKEHANDLYLYGGIDSSREAQVAMVHTQRGILNALIAIALELREMNECGHSFDTPSTKLMVNK